MVETMEGEQGGELQEPLQEPLQEQELEGFAGLNPAPVGAGVRRRRRGAHNSCGHRATKKNNTQGKSKKGKRKSKKDKSKNVNNKSKKGGRRSNSKKGGRRR